MSGALKRNIPLSLKAALERTAAVWGEPYHRLYEVQKRLTVQGLLVPRDGRGPGSGVEFSLEAFALVIAVAAAEARPVDLVAMSNAALSRARGTP